MNISKKYIFIFCSIWLSSISLSAQNSNWTAPNAVDYDFTANAISTIYLDSIISNNVEDRIAFFVGNEIRGLSTPIDIGNQEYRHFITLYSNEAMESMDIKIYHADTDLVYEVATPLGFVVQGIYGSIDSPYELYVYPNDNAPLNINDIPSQETIEGLAFGDINLDDYLVQIDEQEVEWSFTPNNYLDVVLNESLLMVEGVAGFTGGSLTVKATELPITPLSQFAEITIEFVVKSLYDAPAWYSIPSQSIVSGNQFTSINLHDYEYQYQEDSILYDYAPVVNESLTPDPIPLWDYNDNLATNMNIITRVDYTPKYQFNHPDDMLAGFIDGEIRGVATQNNSNGLYFLTLAGSADETDSVTIKFYSGEMKKIITLTDEFRYEQHAIVGSIDIPYLMEMAPIVPNTPLNPVFNGIAVMPVNILDSTYIGTEYFDFFAYDPTYPEYLNAVTQTSFCVVADSIDLNIWYEDMDNDGLGNPYVFIYSCNIVDGYVDNGDDCDDSPLSDYTIIAEDEVHLNGNNTVLNGGVGVTELIGKIKLHDESFVTGTTTFTKAVQIDIDDDSGSDTQILAQADVTLPAFIMNPFDSDNDVEIDEDESEVLTEQIYGKIKVKKGGTVEFIESNVFIEELKVEDGGTVIFAPCSFISVNKKIKFKKDVTVNAAGYRVHIYTDYKADIDEGSLINASIDARGHDIKVDGKEDNPTFMNGQYIAEKVHGDKYVTWDWSDACDPGCAPDELPENITCECDGGMQQITIEYTGGTGASLTTNSGTITDNGDGTYTVYDDGEKLEKNLEISDDASTAEIHTSCSQDILGVIYAEYFTVIGHTDMNSNECSTTSNKTAVEEEQEMEQEFSSTELTDEKGIPGSGIACLKVYPNPASYNMNIAVEGIEENYTIYIFDQIGRQLWKSEKMSDAKKQNFDIREIGFTCGLYQVILKSENHFIREKILIIR